MGVEITATVVVATRNRAKYLADCLESLSRQECSAPFEILIIDNESSDDTPAVIDDWRRRCSRIRTFRETRLGLSAAKNAGARHARGRLLFFTDDDVIVSPQWLSAYLDLFSRVGRNVIAGGPIIPVLNDLSAWPNWFAAPAIADVGLLDYSSERELSPFEYVWGANMGIPSDLFWNVGLWNEDLGRKGDKRGSFEDTEYQDRARATGAAIWFCPAAKLQHRIEPERVTPRRVLGTAFGRGRNDFCRALLPLHVNIENAPREPLFSSAALLISNLSGWLWWALAFRYKRSAAIFARTHACASASGRSLERIRAGRTSSLASSVLAPVVFFCRRLALFLTADAVKRA